jgi:hypothetical protein
VGHTADFGVRRRAVKKIAIDVGVRHSVHNVRPVTNTWLVCSAMIVTSVIAGEYTAPLAQGSTISETLGTTREATCCTGRWLRGRRVKRHLRRERAPRESLGATIGEPVRGARSSALRVFSACASDSEPPNTVKS